MAMMVSWEGMGRRSNVFHVATRRDQTCYIPTTSSSQQAEMTSILLNARLLKATPTSFHPACHGASRELRDQAGLDVLVSARMARADYDACTDAVKTRFFAANTPVTSVDA